jgi:hypothetical protein
MQKFKEHWQITKNWQFLFPLLGLLGLLYSSYKLTKALFSDSYLLLVASVALFLTYVLTRFCLFIFKKLEDKWIVEQRWEMIRIFIIFAITGSSSVLVGRPFIRLLGITQENLNPFLYYILFIFISLVFYQILLVFFGWMLGQFKFFWAFEKKILSRFGLGFLFRNNS